MGKRGQTTIFIIVAILIIAAIALFFTLRGGEETQIKDLDPQTKKIANNIKPCLKKQLNESTQFVTLQGGYFSYPPEYIEYSLRGLDSSLNIPYYLNGKENQTISKKRLEQEISLGTNLYSKNCKNSTQYNNVDIETGNIDSEVSISGETVSAKIKLPTTIKKGDSTSRIEEFDIKIESQINEIRKIAKNVTLTQKKYNEKNCISCDIKASERYNVEIEKTEIDEGGRNIVIYSMKKENKELIYNFAHTGGLENE